MNRIEHLITKAQEEAAELIQRLAKAQCFGFSQIQQPHETSGDTTDVSTNPEGLDNRQRVQREYLHLIAAMTMLGFDLFEYDSMEATDVVVILAKRDKVEHYLEMCRRNGTLVETQTDFKTVTAQFSVCNNCQNGLHSLCARKNCCCNENWHDLHAEMSD